MARITVDDCLENIPSRFDLVVVASKRARQIASFNQSSASDESSKQDKPTLTALREIAESTIDIHQLYQNKTEKEKSDTEDMLHRMQMLDQKITEKDQLPIASNVKSFKQDEYEQLAKDKNPGEEDSAGAAETQEINNINDTTDNHSL